MSKLNEWMEQGRISPDSVYKLNLFVDLIAEWNRRINLTGFKTKDEITKFLIEESVLALLAFPMSGKRVLDFGSGAGIPGLVWAACDATIALTSLEIRQKKISFQKEVLRATGISAEVVAGRFPEAVAGRQFDVIATRAIRYDARLWDNAGQLLVDDGCFLRFAGAGSPERGWRSVKISPRSSLLVKDRKRSGTVP